MLALDLDDTLLDLKSAIISFNNEFFGVKITPEEYSGHWLNTKWTQKYNSKQEFKRVIDHEWWVHAKQQNLYSSLRAMSGSAEVLEKLQKRGASLLAITARPKSLQNETMTCLEREYPKLKFQDVVFLGERGFGFAKGQTVRELGAHALVDDVLGNAMSAVEHGMPSLLFGNAPDIEDAAANETIGLYRAKTWPKAKPILMKMLNLD